MLILDLDGTILTVNSFHRWVLYLVRAPFPHLSRTGRLRVACAALKALVQRKLRLSDHETFKWRLQKLWQGATRGDRGASEIRLTRELLRFVRPELQSVLSEVAEGKIDAILATAAAGDYAYGLGRSLGFVHILATDPTRAAGAPSNVGERKRDAVLALIAERGWTHRPRVLFTDHEDDLPLIRACGSVHWFGSYARFEEIERSVPGIRVHAGFSERDGRRPSAAHIGAEIRNNAG